MLAILFLAGLDFGVDFEAVKCRILGDRVVNHEADV